MGDRPFPLIQLDQVSLAASVGSHYLLHDISLSVFSGDRLAITGPSGAGKTSLLRLLNRLSEPTSGSLKLEQQPLSKFPVTALRQQVVLVGQEPKLLGMTVAETITYPLVLQQLPKREIAQRLETWLAQLKIPDAWLERTELQLSLGQRQLVAIARALVMQPKLLLLDEPTSALDVGRGVHLIKVLSSSQLSETTIVMVNHQLELVQKFANRVVYLHNGQLRQDKLVNQIDWSALRGDLERLEAAEQEWQE